MTLQRFRYFDGADVEVHRIRNHSASKAHDHLFHEIVYVESGSAMHRTADGTTRLHEGDLIVIQPQIWHAYENPRKLNIINFLIKGSIFHQHAEMLDRVGGTFELYRQRPNNPRHASPLVFAAPVDQRLMLVRLLNTVIDEKEKQPDGWHTCATLSALQVLVLVARIGRASLLKQSRPTTTDQSGVSGRAEQAVMEAINILEANYSKPLTLEALASDVHISPAHLSRCFSKRMGMGVVQFMHRLRIEQACRLLRTTHRTVSEIAADVGYDEVAYFSRWFKRVIGQTPREYRKQA